MYQVLDARVLEREEHPSEVTTLAVPVELGQDEPARVGLSTILTSTGGPVWEITITVEILTERQVGFGATLLIQM